MRILILSVGRWKAGPQRALYEAYRERIAWPVELREIEERKRLPPAALKARESALLLAALPAARADFALVALDPTGKAMTSEAFAARLGAWRDEGRGTIAFLIGGADGLAPEARKAADLVLSFGAPTWPHLLVRGMLAEQLYRAQQILAGHPYHRGGE
ncbi:MAG: 23S rRNA (pseudouridine(1915)-N(3))-methyltransferase RlmH [Dongiaceae bacterium]